MGFRMWAAAALLAVGLAGAAQAADTAKVAQGTLRGRTAGEVVSFKGIPFAAPPVGDLRWRAPAAPASWTGERDAGAFGPACMQMMRMSMGPPEKESEDCLYLNVWAPKDAKPGAKLPVMVWIYGGAFVLGSGSTPIYDGAHFAERGVILVTFNYRVGRLGFFGHPALIAETPQGPVANYGVMDTLAALKWVKANAAAFGGDADNVTIFGESAGGALVNVLMASPAGAGLFDKAISQSGFGRGDPAPLRGPAPNSGESKAVAFAKSLGIEGDGQEALKALRALSAQQLSAPVSGVSDPGLPSPTADGVIIKESPAAAFAAGREQKVPYIAGGTSFEASLYPQIAANPDLMLAQAGPLRDKFLATYGGDPKVAALSMLTETQVIEPNRHLARLHARNGQKAWVYYFSYLPEAQRGKVPGLAHGGELTYVFDNLRDTPLTMGSIVMPAATAEDHALAKQANAYWAQFGKTSDPGSAGGPAWPQFVPATETVREFGVGGAKAQAQFRKESLDLAEQLEGRVGPP